MSHLLKFPLDKCEQTFYNDNQGISSAERGVFYD